MQRFKPLDVFRGMTIALMIIVNTPGSWQYVYEPFLHAKWHGFTPTDLVFPSFLFAVGNAFAFVKSRWAEKTFQQVFPKIIKRTLVIFILGYIMYWFPFMKWTATGELSGFPIGETRIMGVLQRIALCYFFAALLIYFLSRRGLWMASAILLLGYWGLLAAFGDYSMAGNFGQVVDYFILGKQHLYGGEGIPFDPEGLLSTVPAIVNVIAGYLVGVYIISGNSITYEKLSKLLLIGVALLVGAYCWDLAFPINKKIWTSSYVILTIGMNIIWLGMLIYFMDFRLPNLTFRFFETFGKNPLFAYLLSGYLAVSLHFIRINGKSLYAQIYENVFAHLGPYLGSLVFALVFMLICWSAVRWLEKRNIYIRV